MSWLCVYLIQYIKVNIRKKDEIMRQLTIANSTVLVTVNL
jgi:hypothetical protein